MPSLPPSFPPCADCLKAGHYCPGVIPLSQDEYICLACDEGRPCKQQETKLRKSTERRIAVKRNKNQGKPAPEAAPNESALVQPHEIQQSLTVVWQVYTRAGEITDHFFLRAPDEFSAAARIAQELVNASPACKLAGARIVMIKRLERLWN